MRILILAIFLSLQTFAQKDTIVHGRHYNYVDYYADKKVKALGYMADTVKAGQWIYFKKDGAVLAKGKYKNGDKIGSWTYFNYDNKKYIKHWEKRNQPHEKIYIDEKGQLNISDLVGCGQGTVSYINGRFHMSAHF